MQDLLQHVVNGISLGSIYALIALGYTMVYGILQMINFAHSDVYMVGAFASYYVARFLKIDTSPGITTLVVLIFVSMLCCSLLGLLIERLAYRPLRNSPKLNILITAIGVSLFLEYAGQLVFGANPKVFPEVMTDSVLLTFGNAELKSFDVTVLMVSLIAMLALHFLMQKTKVGKAMRAVSTNASVAAMLGVNLRGMDNNVLTQIGLVVLIALAAKNAILIVEFARQGEEQHGYDPMEAAVHAAEQRLRPILMTSFAFILGTLPLVVATGAGAELRQALGTAVFFGMAGVTGFGLLFTPTFYVVCRKLGDRLVRLRPPPAGGEPTLQPAE